MVNPKEAAAPMVIKRSELDFIQNTLVPPPANFVAATGDNWTKHLKSKARAETWTNTLDGARKKNLAETKNRLLRDELAKQKVDEQEANIQLENRKRIITRANRILYDEADRVKSFQSKMQLCDVLAEREAQTQLKDELDKLDQIREERYLEMDMHNYRKMMERELREKMEAEDKTRLTTATQKEQLLASKKKRLAKIEDDILEGEMLRRKAVEDAELERRNIMKRREDAASALIETQKANAYLKTVKDEEVKRIEREERKIKEYANHKDAQMKMRKAKMAEIEKEKQRIRQRMIDRQTAALMAAQGEENARTEAAVLEKQLNDEEKRIAKQERLDRLSWETNKSRQQMIERKMREAENKKKEDIEMSVFWGEWCKHLDATEKDEVNQRFQAAKALQSEHKKQISERHSRLKAEKDNEIAVVNKAQAALELDDLEYYRYAENTIREYAEEGKNVIPLINELKLYRERKND